MCGLQQLEKGETTSECGPLAAALLLCRSGRKDRTLDTHCQDYWVMTTGNREAQLLLSHGCYQITDNNVKRSKSLVSIHDNLFV